MHIVCCVKQVPDTTQVKIDPETNTLVRAGVESICNPYDLVASEAAIRLVEKYGGKVTIITMGIPQAETVLRECLSLGANDAVLLSDRALAGADTLATSYTLACAIEKLNQEDPVQIVMFGKQAIDGDTAQTGPGVATRLGYTQLTYVSEILGIEKEKNVITVRREVDKGSEIIEAKLPVVLTVELELASPRYASLPDLIRSIKKDIRVWGAKDLNCLLDQIGLKGSPTSVKTIFAPPPRQGGPVFDATDNLQQSVDDFLNTLIEKESAILEEVVTSNGKDQDA